MKGQSNNKPAQQVKSQGKTQVNYNMTSKSITDDQGTRTIWEYDIVEIEGNVTKAKVLEAIQKAKHEHDTSVVDTEEISTQIEDAKSELLISIISSKSYAQIDTYIDNNVTDIATAKNYLKKLSRVVLAMLKKLNG